MTTSIHRIQANEALFTLAANAIAAYSRRTSRFESVHTACARAARLCAVRDFTAAEIDGILEAAKAPASLNFCLRIDSRWSDSWHSSRERLERAAGRSLAIRECVTVMLQVLVVAGESEVGA